MFENATRSGVSPDPPADASREDDLRSWPTGRLLSTAARMVEGAWTARLAARGLTHAGLMVMHELRAREVLPVLDLASRCQVTAQTMTRTLDRLERDGLVSRRRGEADRRRVEVALTPSGEAAYAAASDMAAVEPDLLGGVVDLPALRDNLVAIIEHLTDPSRRTLPG
jgi:MarR family transcriptional regulator, organic hydroperoxide resistance regulator